MANILRRPTVWNRQPPGAYRIAAAWRSRVMSAWYPLAGVDVVRGDALVLGDGGGLTPMRIVGDRLIGANYGGGDSSAVYASLGVLKSPGDASRISSLTIATPGTNFTARQALFSISSTGTKNDAAQGLGFACSYTTSSAWLVQNAARFVGEQNAGTFVSNERGVYGMSYSQTNPANTVKAYKNGRLIGTTGLDVANAVNYGTGLYCPGGRAPNASVYFNYWCGSIELHVLFPPVLSDAEFAALSVNPWQLFEPIRRSIFAGGIAPIVGTGKAVGGGEAQAAGSGVKTGAGKAVGGGVARSSGSTVKTGAGKAVGGGVAKAAGSGIVPRIGTGAAVGGGNATALGTGARIGSGAAVGGGVARAGGASIRSGSAIAVGGGVAKAAGGTPPPPSVVDHYVKGWPVAASGAVIVHLVP